MLEAPSSHDCCSAESENIGSFDRYFRLLLSGRDLPRFGKNRGIALSLLRRGRDKRPRMDQIRDSIYFEQLARVARLKANATDDPFLARRLREAAVRHEQKARKLKRAEQAPE